VYRFDRVLIDPTLDALSRTLAEASAAANKGFRARLLHWPAGGYADFVTAWRAAQEGQRQWIGPGTYRKRGPGGDTRSAAAVVWWSDPLGRKHCRVVADRVDCGSTEEADLLEPEAGHDDKPTRPMLWRVYPDDLYLRQKGKEWHLWAVCRCGAAGPPETLGWMGPWCAACHDRAEDGAPLSRPGVCPPVVFSGHPFWVADVAFGLGGRALLTRVRYYPEVWIWDTASGQVLKREFPGRSPKALAVSADGTTAAVCVDATIYLWSLLDNSDGLVLPLSVDDPVNIPVDLAFSPDGASLAWTAGEYRNVRLALHDLPTGQQRWSVLVPRAGSLVFSPDGRTIALGHDDNPVSLWSAADGSKQSGLPPGSVCGSKVAYSPDGKTLAAGNPYWGKNYLGIWNAISRAPRASLDGPVTGLAFSPNSRVLAVAGRDGRLRLLDTNGRALGTFRWHQSDINAVAFSPDGCWLASGGNEDRVKLWPVEALLGTGCSARPRRK
jgi:DNA-binding beta-propeller fold protein YncE